MRSIEDRKCHLDNLQKNKDINSVQSYAAIGKSINKTLTKIRIISQKSNRAKIQVLLNQPPTKTVSSTQNNIEGMLKVESLSGSLQKH